MYTGGHDAQSAWREVVAMVVGLVLIVIGVVFFAQSLGFIQDETMQIIWPLLVIVLGLTLLSHKVLGHDCQGKGCWCGGSIDWGTKRKK